MLNQCRPVFLEHLGVTEHPAAVIRAIKDDIGNRQEVSTQDQHLRHFKNNCRERREVKTFCWPNMKQMLIEHVFAMKAVRRETTDLGIGEVAQTNTAGLIGCGGFVRSISDPFVHGHRL